MTNQSETTTPTSPSTPVDAPAMVADTAVSHELETVKKLAADYLAGWQRAKADYLNLKKQSAKEKEEMVKFASAAIVMELLPIFDHLKIALLHVPPDDQNKEWVKGINHILQQFREFFRQFAMEEIKTVGQPFNPELHHAVGKEKRQGVASGSIIEEVKTGFTMHGKVIEPARVKVAE